MDKPDELKWLLAFRDFLEDNGPADEEISNGFPVTIDSILSELRHQNPELKIPFSYEYVSDEYKPQLVEMVEQFCHEREWTWDYRKNKNDLPCILSLDEPGEE